MYIDQVPPPIYAVAQETRRAGWPHAVTKRESEAIVTTVVNLFPSDGFTSGICDFPNGTPSLSRCQIWLRRYDGRLTDKVSIRINVRSNGSYKIRRVK